MRKLVRERESHKEVGESESLTRKLVRERERVSQGSW